MGRKNKYETHVKPRLEEIKEWIQYEPEDVIAKRCGVAVSSFENYKRDHEELREALKEGRDKLVIKLKETLKKKALGFKYTERKTILREYGGKKAKIIEEVERYAQPDLGSIHLLLKNLDSNWHNDDAETISQKRKALEQGDRRIDNGEWA